MKRVSTFCEATSIVLWSSIRLRISEVFSVMISEEAFGTATIEPKLPNCFTIDVKARTISSGLMYFRVIT